MSRLFSQAVMAAETAKQNPSHSFKVGDWVTVHNDDYFGDEGRVSGFETNMLGLPLVTVDFGGSHHPSFYPHELTAIEAPATLM